MAFEGCRAGACQILDAIWDGKWKTRRRGCRRTIGPAIRAIFRSSVWNLCLIASGGSVVSTVSS
jgi:hypothetical protein